LPESEFAARNCTFSLVGKNAPTITLVRRIENNPGPKTRTWLKRTFVRGPDMNLLDLQGASAEILIDESMVAGQNQPLFRIRARDENAVELRAIRSTLVCGQSMLRWRSHDGKRGLPEFGGSVLDSILSCDDSAGTGSMIDLGDDADPSKMHWQASSS